RAPGREPIRLRLEQVVQLVEARRVTGRAVDPRHRGPDVRAYRLGSLYQREQTGACTSRVAATRLYRLLRADGVGRHVLQDGHDAQQLEHVGMVGAEATLQCIESHAIDTRRLPRIDREALPEVV